MCLQVPPEIRMVLENIPNFNLTVKNRSFILLFETFV